jgi:predicted alpha/beta-fold hydrolase
MAGSAQLENVGLANNCQSAWQQVATNGQAGVKISCREVAVSAGFLPAYDGALAMKPFMPHPLLRNAHVMTLAAAMLPRITRRLPPASPRLFETEPGTQLLAKCHWQAHPRKSPVLVVVHGLEGSCDSGYMRAIAEKAFLSGYSVLRVNQRNCGGTEGLTSTLYNSGLSGDYRAVLYELIERDALATIFFAGYSMGGNLVLKMAGDLGSAAPPQLCGVCAVCPPLDLPACVDALDGPGNILYRRHFVSHLRARMKRKQRLFPGQFRMEGLDRVRTVREFDDVITAPYCGYRDAVDYYESASARKVMHRIAVPTLILTSQDDPFVPMATFRIPGISGNPHINFFAPEHGGHCAFISAEAGRERYWAEARVVEFCINRANAVAPAGSVPVF